MLEAGTGFHITYTRGHLKVGDESIVFFILYAAALTSK
jgi:hypothetical protein